MNNIVRKLKRSFGLDEDEPSGSEMPGSAAVDSSTPGISSSVFRNDVPVSPEIRERILAFVMDSLRPFVDEKSQVVSGIRLFFLCRDLREEEAIRIAVDAENPRRFQDDYLGRKMLNHYIQPAPHWFLEYHFLRDELPENILVKGNMGLEIVRKGQIISGQFHKAKIRVLSGKTSMEEYILDPADKLRFNIGRNLSPQLKSGKIRTNDIAFTGKEEPGFDDATMKANLHVSRDHAYIVYNTQLKRFFLYADKGGLPESGNKLKVHTSLEKPVSLTIPGLAHELRHGDQIELGGEAILLFEQDGE